jgi:hypothetical protein
MSYYDQLSNAMMLSSQTGGCSPTMRILRNLAEKRPEDETGIPYLLNCYLQTEDYESGYAYIANLEMRGILPNKARLLLTYNNSGFLLWVKSLTDENVFSRALDLLRRAESIGIETGDQAIKYPLYNLTMLYVGQGDMTRARVFAERFAATDPAAATAWWKADLDTRWGRLLETKQPRVREILEDFWPGNTGAQ